MVPCKSSVPGMAEFVGILHPPLRESVLTLGLAPRRNSEDKLTMRAFRTRVHILSKIMGFSLLASVILCFSVKAQSVVEVQRYARPVPYPWAVYPASTTAGSTMISGGGDFQAGDGIVIAKAGPPTKQAVPAAPKVINWSGVTGSGVISYECVGADTFEGLTAASAPTVYTNAPNFGANVLKITSISRDSAGRVTLATNSPTHVTNYGGNNNFMPEVVQIWGVVPADLDGWFTVQNSSGNTLTILTGNKSAETGSQATKGQAYSWGGAMSLQLWPALAVQCPALIANGPTTHYFIYANYGGGFTLIGSTGAYGWSAAPFSGNTWQCSTFLDWGPFFNKGYKAPPGASVPTTPPSSPQNDMLVAVVTAVSNNLLAINEKSSFTGPTVSLHDDSVQVQTAAATVSGGTLDFSPGGWYVFNAPVFINAGNNGSTWSFGAPVYVNEPIAAEGQSVKITATTALAGGHKNAEVFTGLANPMLALAQTSGDISGISFEPQSAGQLALYLGSAHNEVCKDRFDTNYDTTILAFVNGGFIDHFCDIEWSAGTQLPNSMGASIGIPNYTPPIPAFLFDSTDIIFDGMNYGDYRGIEIGGDGQWFGSGQARYEIAHVATFQSPWTPLVFVYGRSGIVRMDIEDSTMDSNWQPVFSNLGCDICTGTDFTLRANITTGGVPMSTGNVFGAH
jgi:hypothetical protein